MVQAGSGRLGRDPIAIDGKFAPADENVDLLIVGGGSAGMAAALKAARLGMQTILIDENPLDPVLMGMDVPFQFGQRATGVVQSRERLIGELVQNDPAIAEAFEAGVDVRLATTAWGCYVPSRQSQALAGIVVGVEDGRRSWMIGCKHLILATGARDLIVGFDGWDLPGVIGASALRLLIDRYRACAVRRMVVLGSGDHAAVTALHAAAHGVEVAAVVAPGPLPLVSAQLRAEVAAAGIELLVGHRIARAEGGAAGICRVAVEATDGATTRWIECDSVCLAIARTPNIELAASTGARLEFDLAAGGWHPAHEAGRTSLARVQVVGDCAGLGWTPERSRAAAIAAFEGTDEPVLDIRSAADGPEVDTTFPSEWLAALGGPAYDDTLVCLCEGVSRRALLGATPPRYLGAAFRAGEPLDEQRPNMDRRKRITRCGMGECQGRRCRDQATMLVARATGAAPASIPQAAYRQPVRPLPLDVLMDGNETVAMRAHWTSWFGIHAQWVPHWLLGQAQSDIGGDGHL